MQSSVSINAQDDALAKPGPDRRDTRPTIDVRSASLAVLAVIASIYALRWASAVVIPVLLGLMFSYALTPLVNRLQARRIPRAMGAATLLLTIAGAVGSMAYSLSDDATAMIESLPEAAQKLQRSLRSARGEPEGPIAKVRRAAAKLEQAAAVTASVAPPVTSKGVPRVQVEPPRFSVSAYLWDSTLGLVGLVGQALVVLFITFFLLVSGDNFRRKMVRIAGPRLSPVVIFVGVLAFGWLWGLWGLLLGAPLLMAAKVVCDHVDNLKPVGELLGA